MLRLSKLSNRFDCLASTKINPCGSFKSVKSLSSSDSECGEIDRKMPSVKESSQIRVCRRQKKNN